MAIGVTSADGSAVAGSGGQDPAAAAAEAARKAAEEARRRAEEAERKAAQARAEADAAARSKDAATRAKAPQLSQKATSLEAQAGQARAQVRTAQQAANAAAQKAGYPAPFPNEVVAPTRDGFSGGARAGTSAASSSETQASLAADKDYAKLVQTPGGKEALATLGIKDGASLRAYAQRVGSGDPAALAKLDQISKKDPAVGAALGQAIAAGDASAAQVVANDKALGGKGVSAEDRTLLEGMGFTDQEIDQLGAATPELIAAARAKTPEEAAQHLAAAAKAAPALVEKALAALGPKLPEPARSLIADPDVCHALATRGPEALTALAHGDVAGALAVLAKDPKVRDLAVHAICASPEGQAALAALGLTEADVKKAGAAIPELLAALSAAGKGDWSGAVDHLARAGKDPATKALIEKAIVSKASSLPEPAKTLLSDPAVVDTLFTSGAKVLQKLLGGDPTGALAELANDPKVQAAVFDAVGKNKAVKAGLAALGLTLDDLKKAGATAGELIAAAKDAAAGAWPSALEHLQNAAKDPAAQALIERVLGQAAKSLPEPARSLLSNPDVVHAIVTKGPEALAALAKGDLVGALAVIGQDETVRNAAIDAVCGSKEGQKALAALGLTVDDLKAAGGAIPELLAAVSDAKKGNWTSAVKHLTTAAADPDAQAVIEKALVAQASKLPEPVKTLLADPAVVDALLHGAPEVLGKLLGGDPAGALNALGNDSALQTAVFDAVAKNPDVQAGLAALGLTVDDLKAAKGGGAQLLAAAQDAFAGRWDSALTHLRAVASDPNAQALVEKAVVSAAANLPEPVRSALTNPDVVHGLVTQAPEALAALAKGDWVGALGELSNDETLRNLVIDQACGSAEGQQALTALGLTVEDVKGAGGAIPELLAAIDAASKSDWAGALGHLEAAAKAEGAQGLVEKVIEHAASSLPEPAKTLLSDPAVVDQLFEQGPAILEALFGGHPDQALALLAKDTGLQTAVFDALATNPTVAEGLKKLGLTADDLKTIGAALPELLDAAKAIAAGDWDTAAAKLAGLAKDSAVADLIAKGLASAASALPPGSPLRTLLEDQKLVSALLQAGPESISKLLSGGLPGAITAITGNPAMLEALQGSEAVQQLLATLGIDGTQLAEVLDLLPDLLGAAQDVADGDWSGLVDDVATLVTDHPELAGQVAAKLASLLPGEGQPWETARALLSDPAFVQALADPALRDQLGALFAAKDPAALETALAALVQNPAVQSAAANVLWNKYGDKLQQLGFTGPEDLTTLAGAIPSLLEAVHQVEQGHLGAAVEALGAGLQQVPEGVRQAVLDKALNALNLPDWAKAAISGAAALLADPAARAAVRDLIDALSVTPPTEQSIDQFANALGALGGALSTFAQDNPDAAAAFLDALGKLPGSLGALFQNHDLNAAMARSGTINGLLGAAMDLVHGDFMGAVTKLGEAAITLLGYPESDRPIDGVPLTVEGMKNFGRLFQSLFNALPNAVKSKIEAAVAEATGSLLGNIPFIGDAIDTGKDIKELFDEISQGDKFGELLASGQLAVDAAKWTQVGKAFTAPLEMALTILQTVDDVGDTIGALKTKFATIMMQGGDLDPYQPMSSDDRKALREVLGALDGVDVPPDLVAQVIRENPDLPPAVLASVLQAGALLGVPPDQLGEFVNRMKADCQAEGVDFQGAASALHDRISGQSGLNDWDAVGAPPLAIAERFFADLGEGTAMAFAATFPGGDPATRDGQYADALWAEQTSGLNSAPPMPDSLRQAVLARAAELRAEGKNAKEIYEDLRSLIANSDELYDLEEAA